MNIKDRRDIRLTIENKPNGVNKGQVTLKEVQPLHEIPLCLPNEIDLHPEGKDVVPNEHRRRHDCRESQKTSISPPMAELTFNILAGGRTIMIRSESAKRKKPRTVTNLISNNTVINDVNWSSRSGAMPVESWV